jgi:hypothetical protein
VTRRYAGSDGWVGDAASLPAWLLVFAVFVVLVALEEAVEGAPQPSQDDRPAAAAEEAAATAEPSIALPISEPDAAAS